MVLQISCVIMDCMHDVTRCTIFDCTKLIAAIISISCHTKIESAKTAKH